MTVKKVLHMASFIMLISIALPANSAMLSDKTNSLPKTENPRVQELLQRLESIKSMNKSDLTRIEKKDLRKEVKGIKKEMKTISGGIYLSVAAILIIILVLILVL